MKKSKKKEKLKEKRKPPHPLKSPKDLPEVEEWAPPGRIQPEELKYLI